MQKNKNPRRAFDNYPTPFQLAAVGWGLARHYLLDLNIDRVLEPGCGDFQPFLRAAATLVPSRKFLLEGVDLRPVESVLDEISVVPLVDYLSSNMVNKYDAILMNPPFVLAQEFVEKAIGQLSPWGVLVLLARQSFHRKTKARKSFWEKYPPYHVATISPRPSFSGDGKTDGSEYAYYVWAPWRAALRCEQGGFTTSLGWLEWSK